MAQPNDGVCCNVFTNCCGPDALTERWNVQSGDWSIIDSELTPNGEGTITAKKGLCKCDKAGVEVLVQNFSQVGDKFRIIFDYVDENNYKYVEHEIISLAGPVGPYWSGELLITYGSNNNPIESVTYIASSISGSIDFSQFYKVCITEYNIHVYPLNVFSYDGLSAGITGIQHISGSMTYSRYVVRRQVGYDNANVPENPIFLNYCIRCNDGCQKCENFRTSKQIKVEISNVLTISNPSDPCATCNDWNNVFYLDKISECIYEFDTSIVHCCFTGLGGVSPDAILSIRYAISIPLNRVELTIRLAGNQFVIFTKTISNPHNCYDEFVDEQLNFSTDLSSQICLCDFSSATIKVTNIN